MSRGIPTKWIEIKVDESFYVGKRGLQIKVWNKRAHTKNGIFYISVGGLWWRKHEKKNWSKLSWDKLEEIFEKEKSVKVFHRKAVT